MVPPPGSSIYMWMYRQGLRQRPLDDVIVDCVLSGHDVRQKDLDNYWNGWYRHDLMFGERGELLRRADVRFACDARVKRYEDYPMNPYADKPEFQARFVPCNRDNRPMIKWGQGTMTRADAEAWPGSAYLAENLRGTKRIVVDVDGDHGDSIDVETIEFFDKWRTVTHCYEKQDVVFDWFCKYDGGYQGPLETALMPVSYHLTFWTDRVIPTMHFPRAHVDLIGNARNSLRYFKTKSYNGLPPMVMDSQTWDEIMDYVERRERQ